MYKKIITDSAVRFKTKEAKTLHEMFLAEGPVWSEKILPTAENRETARRSITEIDELIRKLRTRISANDLNKVEEAIALVVKYQGNALRKDVKLYPLHPLEVTYNLIFDLGCKNIDMIISAILHDFLEDVKEFKNAHQYLEDKFGPNVRTIVEGMTNKELEPDFKQLLRQHLQTKLKIREDNELEAIITNIEYFIGVKNEIANGATLIVKSFDFGNNALKLANLKSNPATQSRLANKYLYLIMSFIEALNKIEAAQYGVDQEAVRRLAITYQGSLPEITGYAKKWEYYHGQLKAFEGLNLI